jgi:triacylglycerol lipase
VTPPTLETLPNWLSGKLPPTEASFADIVQAYLAFPAPAHFLLTLNLLEKDVEVYEEFSRGVVIQPQPFNKLAETLLLHHDVFQRVADQPAEMAHAVRRAYQHYIINTDGPIPLSPAADDFDVFAWATEYAAGFNIGLKRAALPDGAIETLMTIDDASQPVRCQAWGAVEGRSSAWSLRDVGHLINYRRYGRYDVIPSRLFAFDPAARKHSKANAMWLADISQLVYLREGYVRAQFTQWGFDAVHWIEDKGSDTQAVVATRNDHAVVAFRGTESATDFLTDLSFRKIPFQAGPAGSPTVGKAHRGFAQALNAVWSPVLAALSGVGPKQPIFVCGHSLGAALAKLAALRLVSHGMNVAGVYVYGAPRVGDAEFRDAYNSVLKAQTFLHINHDDVVPTVPPRWVGFDHVAQPGSRFDEGHQISAEEGEDATSADAPQGAEGEGAEAAKRELMAQAARTLRESHRYLALSDLSDLSAGAARGMTYDTAFEAGRFDDHGIAQYLFKFACAIVEEKMAAMK